LVASPATQELAVATRDDAIRIRYDSARNVYEVRAGSFDWSALFDPPESSGEGPNSYFKIAEPSGSSSLSIQVHNRAPDAGRRYQYSNLAIWRGAGAEGGEWGNVVALGTTTPASGVPLSGSASFEGIARGQADIANDVWGATTTTPLVGTVKLNFDFAAGSLAGSLALSTGNCDCFKTVSTGEIAFSNTIFAPGSQTFSGSFNTGVAGVNSFDGRFTGPAAQELIGSWSLPFLFEDAVHQAWGAWIAKRGN
jgi:hypothetical protein